MNDMTKSHALWAAKYNLSTDPLPCESCGKFLERTIPFASGSIRGLRSAPHGCLSNFDHSVSRSIDKADNEAIDAMFSILKNVHRS